MSMRLPDWVQFYILVPPTWIPTGDGASISKFIEWNGKGVTALARTRFAMPMHSYLFSPHEYVHTMGAEENTPPDIFDKLREKVLERKKDDASTQDSTANPPKQSPPTPIESLGDDEFESLEVFNYVSLVDDRVHAVCSWNRRLDSYTFSPEKYIVARGSEQCTPPDIWRGLQDKANYPDASSSGYKTQYRANRPGTLPSSSQNNLIPQPSSIDDGEEEGWTGCVGYFWIDRFWPKFRNS